MKNYKSGDIVWIDMDPAEGHEQKGHRPAVIVSNNDFGRLTGLYMVCPITTNDKDFPTHIDLIGTKTIHGKIMCEHVKSLDLFARNAKKIEECPVNILDQVKKIIELFLK